MKTGEGDKCNEQAKIEKQDTHDCNLQLATKYCDKEKSVIWVPTQLWQ